MAGWVGSINSAAIALSLSLWQLTQDCGVSFSSGSPCGLPWNSAVSTGITTCLNSSNCLHCTNIDFGGPASVTAGRIVTSRPSLARPSPSWTWRAQPALPALNTARSSDTFGIGARSGEARMNNLRLALNMEVRGSSYHRRQGLAYPELAVPVCDLTRAGDTDSGVRQLNLVNTSRKEL